MIDAAISDGDWVVVRQQHDADERRHRGGDDRRRGDGQDLQRRDGHVWLLPHNAAYSPIAGDDAHSPRAGSSRCCARSDRAARLDAARGV